VKREALHFSFLTLAPSVRNRNELLSQNYIYFTRIDPDSTGSDQIRSDQIRSDQIRSDQVGLDWIIGLSILEHRKLSIIVARTLFGNKK
jgi:hypothetical protein